MTVSFPAHAGHGYAASRCTAKEILVGTSSSGIAATLASEMKPVTSRYNIGSHFPCAYAFDLACFLRQLEHIVGKVGHGKHELTTARREHDATVHESSASRAYLLHVLAKGICNVG